MVGRGNTKVVGRVKVVQKMVLSIEGVTFTLND